MLCLFLYIIRTLIVLIKMGTSKEICEKETHREKIDREAEIKTHKD